MTSTTDRLDSELRTGSQLMGIGAVAFIAYAVVFFVLNFTDSFLELGIGPEQEEQGRGAEADARRIAALSQDDEQDRDEARGDEIGAGDHALMRPHPQEQ